MLKVNLVQAEDGKHAEVADSPLGNFLFTTTPEKMYSHFKAATRTTAGTSIVVQPTSGDAIALTDLIFSGEQKDATLTIRFTDGTNTVNVIVIPLTDAALVFGIPFSGRWMGWRDARLEFVTSLDFSCTVAVGYMRVPSKYTLSYAEWDAAR